MSTETPNIPSLHILLSEIGPSVEARRAWFRHMLKTQPIRYRPEYHLWEVFRYKDVQQVLLDYEAFSVDNCKPASLPFALAKFDPPEHRRLRSLVSKAFTPHRIEELTPRLIQIVDELLEPAMTRGKMNVVTELTYPLPMRVIGEMLGLPPPDQERFRQWSYQLAGQMLGVGNPDYTEPLQYFSDLLNERKRDPSDDLISALLAAEENGTRLTREEIVQMCLEMMFAGNVTTTVLLTSALQRFCQQPEIYQILRDDPSLIPGAIEETVRYDFSSFGLLRTARHDMVLDGHHIKAGQYVVVWASAANFDETYFPHPEQFDIRRSPNPHLNFGHGVHTCLGYPLARLEGRVALERIVTHFSEIALDPENTVQYMDQMGVFKLIRSLGILFTPSSRLAPPHG